MKNTFRTIIEAEGHELLSVANEISDNQVEKVIKLIAENKEHNIFITGCGTSAMAAKKVVHTFNVINIPAFYLNPSDAVHGAMGAIQSDDIVFIISKGGETKEITAFLDNLKDKGARVIAITENENSVLAKKANYFITLPKVNEPDKFNMLATASTMAIISIFDSIAISVMDHLHFTKESFLLNHPSGAVGKRLNQEISSNN